LEEVAPDDETKDISDSLVKHTFGELETESLVSKYAANAGQDKETSHEEEQPITHEYATAPAATSKNSLTAILDEADMEETLKDIEHH